MVRVIAEWGQTNQGSVNTAIRQAEVACESGCWGAKWQLLSPERIAARYASAYWSHARPGELQRDTFDRNGMIDYGAWGEVKEICDHLDIEFIATPFDLEAVDALEKLDVTYIKIASGDITYRDLLQKVAATGRRVILSTGASDADDIARATRWLRKAESVTLLACDLVYPCPMAETNLARIETLRRFYAGDELIEAIGYSDHTTGTDSALAATVLGATVLEKHATLDPGGPTPDDSMGLNPSWLPEYVIKAKWGALMRGNGQLCASAAEQPALVGARRAWHATRDLLAGTRLSTGDLVALRPAKPGMVSARLSLEGCVLTVDVPKGQAIPIIEVNPR